MTRRQFTATAYLAATALLAGCGSIGNQFLGNPDATPPARAHVAAGPGWSAATAYLKDHPAPAPKGMQAGILVQVAKQSVFCALNGCTWSGIVVIPGAQTVALSSDSGDNGMASFVSPGDLIEFPARDEPVDAPGDDGSDPPAKLLQRAVVAIP
jgi:hypothetical protein